MISININKSNNHPSPQIIVHKNIAAYGVGNPDWDMANYSANDMHWWLFDLLILMEIMIITVHELILKNNKILVHARTF
jgi:hypothetical protein